MTAKPDKDKAPKGGGLPTGGAGKAPGAAPGKAGTRPAGTRPADRRDQPKPPPHSRGKA